MNPNIQAKLLRAIQEKQIDRVGGNQLIKVDIRIIATSNRDLIECIKNGTFREDLYFRLNVVNLQLPALRERPQDIELLAKHFIQKYSKLNRIDAKPFSEEALKFLKQYAWRGNIRELQNVMHRALLLASEDVIIVDDFGFGNMDTMDRFAAQSSQLLIGKTVAEVEKELILTTLTHCLGNRTHASNILGISIRTLRNKLKEYEQISLAQGM
jgi:DNA-binding NtrC family response regulator